MNQEQQINEILEIIHFLKDNMASKDDLKEIESRMGGLESRMGGLESRMDQFERDLMQTKTEIINHLDGFTVITKSLEQEVYSTHAKCERIEQSVVDFGKHMNYQVKYIV